MVQGRGGNQKVKNYREDGGQGRSTQRREWEGGSIKFRNYQKPHTQRRRVGHPGRGNSGYGDVFAQVDVLNGVEELHTVGHGALEGFATADKAGAACALVDDRGSDGVFEVVGAGRAAGIDEAGSAHEAVGDLVAG